MLLLVAVAACRSAAPPAGPVDPWRIDAGDLSTQQLFRLHLRDADGETGSVRLAMRLRAPTRFELAVTDPLGRSLWVLTVVDQAGVLRERDGPGCRLSPTTPRTWPRLGPGLPAAYLPFLLLGRLPAAPAEALAATPADGALRFHDSAGRLWEVVTVEGRPESWRREATDGAALAWQRDDDGARLAVEGDASVEVRWRRLAREPLRLEPRLPADSASLEECRFDDLP